MAVFLNPNDKQGNLTLSNNNLTVALPGDSGVRASEGKSSGKWYWEVTVNTIATSGGGIDIGACTSAYSLALNGATGPVGTNFSWWSGGLYRPINTAANQYGNNHVIGVLLNCDDHQISFSKNGAVQGTPYTNLTAGITLYPVLYCTNSGTNTATINFGATQFAYAVPSGYTAFESAPVDKFLIQDGTEIFTVSGGSKLKVGDIPATESMMTTSGLNDLTTVTSAVLATMTSPKVLYYKKN